MNLFILQFTLASSLFYMVYILMLSQDTFFQWRRIYLLGAIMFSLVLPFLIQLQWFQVSDFAYSIRLPLMEITGVGQGQVPTEDTLLYGSFTQVLYIIYAIGVVITSIKLLRSGIQLLSLIKSGQSHYFSGFTIINVKEMDTPFSFFNYIVMDLTLYSDEEAERIILHEQEHVMRRHSIDVILMEVLSVVLWFHPIIYLFKKQLRINHEYQADQRVIAQYSRKQYGHILLKQSNSGKAIVFANYFFHSFIKKRIMMMYNERSHKNNQLKYLLVFPLVFGLLFSLSNCTEEKEDLVAEVDIRQNDKQIKYEDAPQEVKELVDVIVESPEDARGKDVKEVVKLLTEKNASLEKQEKAVNIEYSQERVYKNRPFNKNNSELPPPPPPPPPAPFNKDDVFKVVEQMPRFPGCEDRSSKDEKAICAQKNMLHYIYDNLKYPTVAKESGVQGTVVLQFVVGVKGDITNIKMVRNIGAGCGTAALKVLESMNDMPEKWTPGYQRGKAVKVLYTLPIKFKLAS